MFDLSVDQREQAHLATKEPALLAELRDAWNRIEATLLDHPPGAVRGR